MTREEALRLQATLRSRVNGFDPDAYDYPKIVSLETELLDQIESMIVDRIPGRYDSFDVV